METGVEHYKFFAMIGLFVLSKQSIAVVEVPKEANDDNHEHH
jgi:hypothetical protein